MKIKFEIVIIILLLGCSDPIANKRTSRIYDLNVDCVSDSAWLELKNGHSINNIQDSKIQIILNDFKMMPFGHEIYYFKENPEELIAVSSEHDCVRYIYNPLISKNVLDGLSPELSKKEKERVGNRIQLILRKYQCKQERNHRYVQEWDKDTDSKSEN